MAIQHIVLINPNYQAVIQDVAQVSVGPPLGLAYLAAVLEKNGFVATIIDANAERLSDEAILKKIQSVPVDAVGLTAVTPTIDMCHRLAGGIKKMQSNILTIIGGCHASALPRETMETYPAFDFLIRGEGEYVLNDFLTALNNDKPLDNVNGLFYRKDGRIIANNDAVPPQNLDLLPLPARHLLPNKRYRTFDASDITTVVAMRGCHAPCVYCAVNTVSSKYCRRRNPLNVAEEIKQSHLDHGARFIGILDDTFTFHAEWVHTFCSYLIKKGINKKINWSCLTRVDKISESLLRHMKQAGCVRVEFGVESGSQYLLDALKKGICLQQIKDAFAMAKRVKLSTFAFVMVNSPGETKKTLEETKRLIFEIKPDFLQVSYATPYPGTPLFDFCKENKILMSQDWSQYIFLNHQIIRNDYFQPGELQAYVNKLQRTFYLRPPYLCWLFFFFLSRPQSWPVMLFTICNACFKLRKTHPIPAPHNLLSPDNPVLPPGMSEGRLPENKQ